MKYGTILMPAYGRTYADADAMRKDWLEGMDFRMYGCGRYCSVRDLPQLQAHWRTAVIIDPRGPATITLY